MVKDEDLVKVHVHTLRPGEALNVAQRYGEFIKLKIENMKEQHSSLIENKEEVNETPRKKNAMIAVGVGEGIVNLFNVST